MKKEEPKILLNKGSLILRIVVGAYLLYTAYSLIGGIFEKQGRDQLFFGIFTVVFFLLGVGLLFFSIKSFIRGEYIGGLADNSSDEESVSEETGTLEDKESQEKESQQDTNEEDQSKGIESDNGGLNEDK